MLPLEIGQPGAEKRGGGLSQPVTGSVGVVTINIPRLGYLSADEDEFLSVCKSIWSWPGIVCSKRNVLEKMTELGYLIPVIICIL